MKQASKGAGKPKIKAPRIMSFAASTERQFSLRHTESMQSELRSVPGKGLARRNTKFVEKDELDEEVHVSSTTDQLPSCSSASQQTSAGKENTILLKRSGSMTQYDAMSEALELLDKEEEEDEEEGKLEKVEKGSDEDLQQEVRQPEEPLPLEKQQQAAQVMLERKPSTVVVFQDDPSSSNLIAQRVSSGNIRIQLSSGGGSGGAEGLSHHRLLSRAEHSAHGQQRALPAGAGEAAGHLAPLRPSMC